MTSAGGGIAVEPSGAVGAGVLSFDSETFSPGEDVTPGSVFDVVDDAVLASGSTLTSAMGANVARLWGDNLRVTMSVFADFFGREAPADNGEALTGGAILMDSGGEVWERDGCGKMTEV